MQLEDTVKHKAELIDILQRIYKTPNFIDYLGFKGGTAAFLFYGLNRFSVDLDFNLLDQKYKDIVKETIINILNNKAGKIKEEYDKRYTLFFLYSYEEGKRNIKIEISKRGVQDNYENINFLGTTMKVITKEDMFAHKLIALTARKILANRDIFDINYFFSEQWKINTKIIEDITKKSPYKYLEEVKNIIENVPQSSILSGLGELLDNDKEKLYVKKHLKQDTIFQIDKYLYLVNIYKHEEIINNKKVELIPQQIVRIPGYLLYEYSLHNKLENSNIFILFTNAIMTESIKLNISIETILYEIALLILQFPQDKSDNKNFFIGDSKEKDITITIDNSKHTYTNIGNKLHGIGKSYLSINNEKQLKEIMRRKREKDNYYSKDIKLRDLKDYIYNILFNLDYNSRI